MQRNLLVNMPRTISQSHCKFPAIIWSDLLIITLIMAIGLSLYGVPVLFSPDEGRYAEIAREMLANHQYIVPYLDGVIYFEKPPLMYWLVALSLKIFGLNEWAARLPNPLLSLIGVWLVYIASIIVYKSRRVALWSAIISGTSLLYLGTARYLNLDAGIAFFITATMLCFWVSQQYNKNLKSHLWIFAAFAFAGLAVMTKGLIGIVFPMMIVGLWSIITCQWKILQDIRLYLGLIIVAIIAVPWIIAVNNYHPEFWYYYIVVQQILRYVTDEQGRQMTKLLYFGIAIIGFFPWFGFLPQAIQQVMTQWKTRHSSANNWFLLIWGGSILLFFAFSQSILTGYLMPIIVPFSILIARYLDTIINQTKLPYTAKLSIIAALILFAILAIGFIIIPFIPQFSMFFIEIACYYWPAAIIAILVVIFGGRWLCQNDLKSIMLLFTAAMAIIVNLSFCGAEYLAQKTVKPLTTILLPLLKTHPNAIVANYGEYFYDGQFYLNRLTWIVDNPGELAETSKMANSGAENSLYHSEEFWPIWDSNNRVFVFMDKDDYRNHFVSGKQKGYLLGQTPKCFLLTNHPISGKRQRSKHQ
jgi:4-amino-4-deoxy-L-arabinose transferase-like glycosyltransferase